VESLDSNFNQIRFIYKHTGIKGANKARNLGLSSASGEIILFIDDDCILQNDNYLLTVYNLHKINPEITGIGGPYILPESYSLIELADHNNSQTWANKCQFKDTSFTSQLLGGNGSFKRLHILPKMKFNENIIYGGAEYDFNLRLLMHNKKLLFSQELSVIHNQKLTLWGFIKKAFKQGLGQSLIERTIKREVIESFSAHIDFSINEFESMGEGHQYVLFWLQSLYSVFFDAGKLYGHSLSQTELLSPHKHLNFKMIYFAIKVFFGQTAPNLNTGISNSAESNFVISNPAVSNTKVSKSSSTPFLPEHQRRIPQLRFYSLFYWSSHRIVNFFRSIFFFIFKSNPK
jgi:glycosyltransferase involved in cell wall biosynthesis